MRSFVYDLLPSRVVFGPGTIDRLADEVKALGAKRALVLSTPGQRKLADEASRRLGVATAGIYAEAVMHVPVETARAAREMARRIAADCIVAIGGGSTIGLAKAIAVDTKLPIIAIPTTYSGSEMTPIYGMTEAGLKRTARDAKAQPRIVIYDPNLTVGLPATVSGPSGMNAIAHCVEALYAENGNPITSLMAAEGLRALAHALPMVVREPENIEARGEALYGAWLAGAGLGAKDAAQGLYDLAKSIGAPLALKDIGMPEDGLDRAAQLATENPYYNPRPVEQDGVRKLLEDAYHGRRPAA